MVLFDVAMITFSCVMFIHMGLVDAILDAYCVEDKDVPIITCPKCLTYWCSLAYLLLSTHDVILSVAASFLASYCAIWFDLLLGRMDVWYEDIYGRISEEGSGGSQIHHEDNREQKGSDGSVSEV